MDRIIDFEAHYYPPELLEFFSQRDSLPQYNPQTYELRYTADFAAKNERKMTSLAEPIENRIARMDSCGVSKQILSVSAGIELLDTQSAIEMSHLSNRYVFDAMQKYPDRFSGYATLPVKDIDASIKELELCMEEYGFFGWNIFSNFGDTYPDDERYDPLFAAAERLGAAIYLHPAPPMIDRLCGYGPILSGGGAGFGYDTAITLLRLIFSGVFDRYPNLQILIGHLGEALPFTLDRLDIRSRRPAKGLTKMSHPIRHYFENNILVTNSGIRSIPAFICASEVLGIGRIVFGSDDPYEKLDESIDFTNSLGLTQDELKQICYQNAERYFPKIK